MQFFFVQNKVENILFFAFLLVMPQKYFFFNHVESMWIFVLNRWCGHSLYTWRQLLFFHSWCCYNALATSIIWLVNMFFFWGNILFCVLKTTFSIWPNDLLQIFWQPVWGIASFCIVSCTDVLMKQYHFFWHLTWYMSNYHFPDCFSLVSPTMREW